MITSDHREQSSSIPNLLRNKGLQVKITTLKTGDFLINEALLTERKSATDFIQSINIRTPFQSMRRACAD